MKNYKLVLASLALTSCNVAQLLDPLQLPKLDKSGKPRNMVFILSVDHLYDYMEFVRLDGFDRWHVHSFKTDLTPSF